MLKSNLTGIIFDQQYEIQEMVEHTGVVQSYRAYQPSLQRTVAVHVLDPIYRSDPIWPQALLKGARIAAQYAHPNIVPVFHYGCYEDVDYVVLRAMEGGTLLSRVRQGPLEIQEAISAVKQIAAALDYVHAQGGCHGDPATVNIVFDSVGNAFIAEFYLLGYLKVTSMQIIAGVAAYMSPERMIGAEPTPLTDQYALAGIAYNMLTAQLPWENAALARLPINIEQPQKYRQEIPTAVNEVLLRALAKSPDERFPTIMDFARQFEAALKDVPRHVFISYSQHDKDYVRQLRDHLRYNSLEVWFDEKIEHGDHWFNDINEAVKDSTAVIVVMSPEAEQSEWVHKEILLAKRYRKPIFPLLLRGEELPILIDLQYEDVRDSSMPGADFHRRIARTVYGV